MTSFIKTEQGGFRGRQKVSEIKYLVAVYSPVIATREILQIPKESNQHHEFSLHNVWTVFHSVSEVLMQCLSRTDR